MSVYSRHGLLFFLKMEKKELNELYNQLLPIMYELAEIHTSADRICIEYPVGTIFIDFK